MIDFDLLPQLIRALVDVIDPEIVVVEHPTWANERKIELIRDDYSRTFEFEWPWCGDPIVAAAETVSQFQRDLWERESVES
jgi:hypothetical protein